MDAEAILREKGWGRNEAKKTADIIAHAQAAKTPSMHFLEQSVFWVALLVAILGNFIISVVLVPFLLLLDGIGLYATIIAVGVTFGLLFNVIIGYIEKLNEGQHIIAGAFIPALALINIYIIAHFSNRLEILLQLATPAHSPLGISVTYVAAFVLPYVLKHFQHLKEKRL
jgi:hypothetical protein